MTRTGNIFTWGIQEKENKSQVAVVYRIMSHNTFISGKYGLSQKNNEGICANLKSLHEHDKTCINGKIERGNLPNGVMCIDNDQCMTHYCNENINMCTSPFSSSDKCDDLHPCQL